jgi:glutathione S-transferase
MASKPQLGYWDNRTICEPIRLLLALAEVDYEDVRYPVGAPPTYDKSQWNQAKWTLGLVAPNLPYWIEDESGLRLTQSRTILMHIAEGAGLAGDTPQRRALVSMALDVISDWMNEFMRVTYANVDLASAEAGVHEEGATQARPTAANFERLRATYVAEALPRHLDHMARLLALTDSADGGSGGAGPTGWLVGASSPTVADVVLCEYIDQHLAFAPECLNTLLLVPLRAHHERVLRLPTVHEYRASERFKAEPLHNRYSHFHTGWVAPNDWARRGEEPPTLAGAPADAESGNATTVSQQPPDAVRLKVVVSPAMVAHKERIWRRDAAALVALLACIFVFVLIGRAAIGFSEEHKAETTFVSAPARPAACADVTGLQPCADCCCAQ